MSRLIDASNLNFEGQHYNKSQMKAILDFIDAQPTAYDVDAVVAELEDASTMDDIDDAFYIRECKAIDIVRKGGIENE